MDRGAWQATSPRGCTESDMTEHKHAHHPKKRIQNLGLIQARLIQPLKRKQRNKGCLLWTKKNMTRSYVKVVYESETHEFKK